MSDKRAPVLVWFRRDLRLRDHAALTAAAQSGRPVVPVFLCDETVEQMGAAPKWRLGLSVEALSRDLKDRGLRLILRRGRALECLKSLIAETGAETVMWTRLYDPDAVARDTEVKAALKAEGIAARSFPGHVLFEPWTVETGSGGFYRVYSPFWRAVQSRDPAELSPRPSALCGPECWPGSDRLAAWDLGEGMRRGADVVAAHVTVGEAAAQDRLERFITEKAADYADQRDMLAKDVTSGLSENLAWGEIAPSRCWQAAWRAHEQGVRGAEKFLKELVWRDFAYHLVYHTPHITSRNWRPEWEGFPWSEDPNASAAQAWRQGRTGMPVVDAAMREMYVTGRMHNRARMIAASYLTKHLLTDWRIGMDWFEHCLIDWDPASNAMGWQWVAGSGPDAAPFFRIFNPVSQAEKFDPQGEYVRKWVAEGQSPPSPTALTYFQAIPKGWGLSPDDPYPAAIASAPDGRASALAAYESHKAQTRGKLTKC